MVAAATAAITERLTVIDPGGGDLRDRDEKDPERDRSRKRQDPKQAHHSAKARAGAASGGVTSSTGHAPPVVPMHRRTTPAASGRAAGEAVGGVGCPAILRPSSSAAGPGDP